MRRYRWWISVSMAAALLGGVAAILLIPPLAISSSLLHVASPSASLEQAPISGEELERMLLAAPLLERTAQRLGIRADARTIRTRHLRRFAVERREGGRFVVEIETASVDLAREWTKTTIAELQTSQREAQPPATGAADSSDDGELAAVNQRLDQLGRVRVEAQNPAHTPAGRLALLRETIAASPAPGDLPREQASAEEHVLQLQNQLELEYENLLSRRVELQSQDGPAVMAPLAADRGLHSPLPTSASPVTIEYGGLLDVRRQSGLVTRLAAVPLALLLGAAVAAVGILMMEARRRFEWNPKRIETALQLPILGFMTAPKPQRELIMIEQAGRIAAGFPEPRAVGAARLVLITAPEPGSGKASVAVQLAAALAERPSRTLLLDADLRHPALHRHFGCRPAPGVADLLARTQPHDGATRNPRPNLDIVTAGVRPAKATASIKAAELSRLLSDFEPRYQFIVAILPSVSENVRALKALAEGSTILLTVRRGQNSRAYLKEVARILRNENIKITGFILHEPGA